MDMLDLEDKRLDLRRKQWEALCEKYEIRGEINTADCGFSEVNYKMFIKSSSKRKFKGKKNKTPNSGKIIKNQNIEVVDVSHKVIKAEKSSDNTVSSTNSFINVGVDMLINENSNDSFTLFDVNNQSSVNVEENLNFCKSVDSGVEMGDKDEFRETSTPNSFINIASIKTCNLRHQNGSSEVHSTEDDHLHKLTHYIEKELKSNLKVILKKRSASKLLELDEYSYWHKCTKDEMIKLRHYISKNDLKEYMRDCYSADIAENNMRLIEDVIVLKLKSNLHSLFFKRELSRHNKTRYLKYHSKVILEWQRLCKVIHVDYLLLYGTAVLKSFRKEKEE